MDGAGTQKAPELLLERVQELQERLDREGDGPLRALADELVAAVVEMYGEGLARVLATLRGAGAAGEAILAELAEEPFVSTLLLIHDLHPVSLEQRVAQALDSVRPYMESHGGSVALLSLSDGVARIALRGSCSDCSASAVTLELAIKQALDEAAPDLEGLEVEGMAPAVSGVALPMATAGSPSAVALPMAAAASPSAVALPMAGGAATATAAAPPTPDGATPAPAWFALEDLGPLEEGELRAISVAGQPLVLANVQGTLLAYRDACGACGAPLSGGELSEGRLRCPACAHAFLLPRAGRSAHDERLQLAPVPLLRDRGGVRVALVA
jgi:Fe-S cluster biogenesis protein NfuA/nitrite reductase/ring-hydroxylating ferredoxin subunit